MRIIDILVGGTNLCDEDNNAFVPQLRESLEVDLDRLKQFDSAKYQEYLADLSPDEAHTRIQHFHDVGEPVEWIEGDALYGHFRFLDWGPTTDGVLCFLIPLGDSAYLTYEFWRKEHPRFGAVRAVTVTIPDLIATIADTLVELAPSDC